MSLWPTPGLLHSLWDELMQDVSRRYMQIHVRMRNENRSKCPLVPEVLEAFREAVPFWRGILLPQRNGRKL